jgi:hypothetical protein
MSAQFKAGRVIAPDSKWTGEEPDWHGWEKWDTEKFYRTRQRALQFYNYYLDSAAMKPMVLAWMKKEGYSQTEIGAIKDASPNVLPSTVGKLVRCLERGMPSLHPAAHEYYAALPGHETPPVPKDDRSTALAEINAALALLSNAKYAAAQENNMPKAYVPSPLERIKSKVEKEIISALLDPLIDAWCDTSVEVATINLVSYLRDGKVPTQGCKFILEWLNAVHAEYNGAYAKEDPQLVEGYSYLPRPDLRKIVKNLEVMIGDVNTHAKIKVSMRKPRVKKVKDASKQVAKLKYQTNSSEYNIDSINPSRIPTAQRLYVFNTKTRQLGVYFAKGSAGFEVKGTSINAYDTAASYTATLRKPKDLLNAVLGSAPKALEKTLEAAKLKKKPANGRFNEHTVLLKVIENKL